ncbi:MULTISPECIES: NAD(P)/FAD-dependent oxidoreductase [unclassified Nocardioides]|uniref:NAD(P)/FAD-dependent oxidoreductase n=1 Tax=unclassified Nocardioides TaxID=2615069 RepID=UPI001885D620|nr:MULTISPECIES: FAD-dependent oxidoreductase [unclassified Nocardioides]
MAHIVPKSIVVIGAGLAGFRVCEQLRTQGYTGTITLVGKEDALPYDRPPLSKQVLTGAWEPERASLCDAQAIKELDVDLRLGVSCVGLGVWTAHLSDGAELRTDATIIATGSVPCTIPGQPEGVLTLRTLQDSLALKDRLVPGSSLLIVGGGFIAAEVATAARAAGVDVTVVEAAAQPCVRQLGERAGELVGRLFEEAGVALRTRTPIAGFVDATTVEVAGGERITSDNVLVSVGSTPDVAWLQGTELPIGEGILAGGTGRVPPLPMVWALGDSTSWWDQPRRGYARNEHWTSASDQAQMVAADILLKDTPTLAPPYIWSDQFGMKIQVLGRPDIADEVVQLEGDGLEGGPVKGAVLGYRRGGHLLGVVSFGAPARFAGYRDQVVAGTKAITTVAVEID